jgi:DNA-directed RNA polymerase specialized sigma24 family protein
MAEHWLDGDRGRGGDRREQLRVLIADLRRDHQHLLALRYGAGLSYDELGAAMNIAPGTARVGVTGSSRNYSVGATLRHITCVSGKP